MNLHHRVASAVDSSQVVERWVVAWFGDCGRDQRLVRCAEDEDSSDEYGDDDSMQGWLGSLVGAVDHDLD